MIIIFTLVFLVLNVSSDYLSEWSPCPLVDMNDHWDSWNRWTPFQRFRHIECEIEEQCPNKEETCNLHLKSSWPFNNTISENDGIVVHTPP